MSNITLINHIPCRLAAPGYEVEIKKHNIKGVIVDVIAIPGEVGVTLQFNSQALTLHKEVPIRLIKPLAVTNLSDEEVLSIATFDLINSIGSIDDTGPKLTLKSHNGEQLPFEVPYSVIETAHEYFKKQKATNKYACLGLSSNQ